MAEKNEWGGTAGPWHVGGNLALIIYAEDGYAIADAKTYHGRHGGIPVAQANARAIAEVPAMVQALRELEAALTRDMGAGYAGVALIQAILARIDGEG